MNLSGFQDLVGIVESLVTVAAIVIGGWWSYQLFVKKRLSVPRARLEQELAYRRLTDNNSVLFINLNIINTGEVLLVLEEGRTFVRQILPASETVVEALESNNSNSDETRLKWPLISSKSWKEASIQIEPGENHHIISEAIIPNKVATCLVHSRVSFVEVGQLFPWKIARHNRTSSLGWDVTTIYECNGSPGFPGVEILLFGFRKR
jgi:hypothetical protein